MAILLIDTSQQEGLIALHLPGQSPQTLHFQALEQSKILLPSIDALLSKNALSLNDLSAIAVCEGPGSFTGTRIGLVTARALAFAKKIRLIPFNSLVPFQQEGALPILDARNGECFTLLEGQVIKCRYEELPQNKPLSTPHPELISQHLPHATLLKASYAIEEVIFELAFFS